VLNKAEKTSTGTE